MDLKTSVSPLPKPKPSGVKATRVRSETIRNILGRSVFSDSRDEVNEAVGLTAANRQNHTHIIGSTGMGKSKLIELMIRQDIKNRNCGLCLIDPHGSLYEEIVAYIAHKHPAMAKRVILFNPAGETEQVLGFNPIPDQSDGLDYVLDMLISACLKAWGQDNTDRTPRITKWLENIFYTIIANDLTLVESPPLLSVGRDYGRYRQKLLAQVNNEVVLDDWQMFDRSTDTQKQTLIEGAANRLRKFLRSDIIRHIVGQKTRSLKLETIIAKGEILLVNLAGSNKISPESTQLLGVMLVNEIFRTAKLRNPMDRTLKPFYLYIDEFGQFITRDIARALEECRKYKLFLLLAHQHLAQLSREDPYLYSSVLTNCKNKVVFGGLAQEDARIMADEIITGFVDLKAIKDEIVSTKERHVEEVRDSQTRNYSQSRTKSRARTQAETSSHSTAVSESETKGTTETTQQTDATSRGQNFSQGVSHNWQTSVGDSAGSFDSTGLSKQFGGGSVPTHTASRGNSQANNQSFGQGAANSRQEGRSQSLSHSHSQAYGRQDSQTKGKTVTEGQSDSHSQTHGAASAKTRGYSYTRSPFLKPEAYREVSNRTYWSQDELHYQALSAIKNQPTGQAFVKIGNQKPKATRITHVQGLPTSPLIAKRLSEFKQQAMAAHPAYYTPALVAKAEAENRQRIFFGEPLRFDESGFVVDDAEVIEIEVECKPSSKNPFD